MASNDDVLRRILVDEDFAAQDKARRKFRIQAKLEPVTRFAAIGLIAGVAFTSRWLGFTSFGYMTLAVSTVYAFIIHGLFTWWLLFKFIKEKPFVYDVVTWSDFFLMTIGVYFTGGETSVLFFIYIVRIADQITTNPKRILYFSAMYPLFYGSMLLYIADVDGRPIDLKLEALKVLGVLFAGVYLMAIGRNVQSLKRRLAFFIREAKHSFRLSERQRTELLQINQLVRSINSQVEFQDFLNLVVSETRKTDGINRVSVFVKERRSAAFFNAIQNGEFSWGEIRPGESPTPGREMRLPSPDPGKEITVEPGPPHRLIMAIYVESQSAAFFIYESDAAESPFTEDIVQNFKDLHPHITSAFIKTQLLNELRQLNEMKNEFLGIAAHDLRSPLSAIIGYLEIMLYDLQNNQFDAVSSAKDMQDLIRVARKMIHLITNLLDLSAIESGKIELELHKVNLSEILEESKKLHERNAGQKNIRLIVENDESLPAVIADSLRLSEVVDNLLSNAIKYTYAGGEVRVFCEVHTDEVVTNIVDTGMGISEDDMEKLFKGFAKLGSKPTGGELSTGLGLAIVKKIVDLHGGKVWVKSKKDQGSVFSFSLPVAS